MDAVMVTFRAFLLFAFECFHKSLYCILVLFLLFSFFAYWRARLESLQFTLQVRMKIAISLDKLNNSSVDTSIPLVFECSKSNLMTSFCPFAQAHINAFVPSLHLALKSMLLELYRSNRTTSVCP